MPRARCKFKVSSVELLGDDYEKIHLSAYCGNGPDATPEDQVFTKFTPSGELTFDCRNPSLCGKFKPQQVYYLDLVPVDEEDAGS